MRPVVLHPGSLAIGVVVAAACMFVASAQSPQVESTLHPAPRKVEFSIAGIPDPRDAVFVRQVDGPYTVPVGKALVITALGGPGFNGGFALLVDGISTIDALNTAGTSPTVSLSPIPSPGLLARAGSVVTIGSTRPYDCFTGYLVDAKP